MCSLLDDILHADDTSYLTHGLHPYPAKFIPQIPRRMIEKHTRAGDIVCDPFCGSGTTLVEARILHRRSIGSDIHPIATLVTRAKTHPIGSSHARSITEVLSGIRDDFKRGRRHESETDFYNKSHWFASHVQDELEIILYNIDKAGGTEPTRTFLRAILSSIIVKVSNQQSDTRYAAVDKQQPAGGTIRMFESKTGSALERMGEFRVRADAKSGCKVYDSDARNMAYVDDRVVDLIVTSPPYPNVYDYYLYHKHRMNWLGMDVDKVKNGEIGSRLRYSSMRWDISTFQKDMDDCMGEMFRVLKRRGVAVVVIGDSVVQGKMIDGHGIIKASAEAAGLRVTDHVKYEMDQTSRSFSGGFRNRGKMEHVITMVKK